MSDEDLIRVAAVNRESVDAFLACETQWRTAGTMARIWWIGLDYVACDVVLRRRRCSDQVFDDLQAMEAAALETLNAS